MNIPVSFEYNGKQFNGVLSPIAGAGSGGGSKYSLLINNYFKGELYLAEHITSPGQARDANKVEYQWRFASVKGEFEELTDYFVDVLTAWHQ